MNYLFDYGEAVLCCLPLFFIIAIAGGALLVTSLPKDRRTKEAEKDDPR